jgi:hypothetical protein
MSKATALKGIQAVKAMLPQDEFIHSDLLSEFINEFSVDHVFSVAPPSTWKAIYRGIDFGRVQFHNVLTGYLDEERLPKIAAIGAASRQRPIDIGYRTAGRPVPWFGCHGYLKQQIAEIFQEKAAAKGLVTDISTRDEDAIPGDAWYDFLARCKYTLGVESGTSLIDPDGTLRGLTEAYLARHPQAPFSDVEAACFPGLDGRVNLYALSPRHLEACVTRTCQILTEGDYNGILEAGTHYIPLKKDFSNIDDVLERVARGDGRDGITERAYDDIVASGRYTYRHFVRTVVETSLEGRPTGKTFSAGAALFHWMAFAEALERSAMNLLYPFKSYLGRTWMLSGQPEEGGDARLPAPVDPETPRKAEDRMSPSDLYTSGEYLEKNPTWDLEDSDWKADLIFSLLNKAVIAPSSICEIGCGAGGVLARLRSLYPSAELRGYDISPDVARFWPRQGSMKIDFTVGDFLELDRNTYDVVLLIDLIEHLNDPRSFLRSLHGSARYFVFHIPLDLSALTVLREEPILNVRRKVGHIHYYTKNIALELLTESGYQVLDWQYSGAAFTSPKRTWKTRVAAIPRAFVYGLNKDLGVRLLGGETLFVLATPEQHG